jgi:hydroxymethylpyrimidine pyrophosphatase-like HAD family hydrolase
VVPTVLPSCHLVVGEEGGVLVDVGAGTLRLLADPLEAELVDALRAAGVPDLDVGHVVVGAPVEHRDALVRARDLVGSHRHLVVNKGSAALAPIGCDKASGLLAAVTYLGAEGLPIVAIGDAANDLPMFAMATFPYAVANADRAVREAGIPITRAAAGSGVAEALRRHLPI